MEEEELLEETPNTSGTKKRKTASSRSALDPIPFPNLMAVSSSIMSNACTPTFILFIHMITLPDHFHNPTYPPNIMFTWKHHPHPHDTKGINVPNAIYQQLNTYIMHQSSIYPIQAPAPKLYFPPLPTRRYNITHTVMNTQTPPQDTPMHPNKDGLHENIHWHPRINSTLSPHTRPPHTYGQVNQIHMRLPTNPYPINPNRPPSVIPTSAPTAGTHQGTSPAGQDPTGTHHTTPETTPSIWDESDMSYLPICPQYYDSHTGTYPNRTPEPQSTDTISTKKQHTKLTYTTCQLKCQIGRAHV